MKLSWEEEKVDPDDLTEVDAVSEWNRREPVTSEEASATSMTQLGADSQNPFQPRQRIREALQRR
jgi:hypothetical protein